LCGSLYTEAGVSFDKDDDDIMRHSRNKKDDMVVEEEADEKEDEPDDEDVEEPEKYDDIPVVNASGAASTKIVEFLNYYQSTELHKIGILFNAPTMELVPLLDLASARKSRGCSWGKKSNDILKLPKITDEEIEKAKKDHPWIFEDPPKWDTDDNNDASGIWGKWSTIWICLFSFLELSVDCPCNYLATRRPMLVVSYSPGLTGSYVPRSGRPHYAHT
jgi:hypothetical protein